jgi:hypothetical protein
MFFLGRFFRGLVQAGDGLGIAVMQWVGRCNGVDVMDRWV